jgi:hypothetical protein
LTFDLTGSRVAPSSGLDGSYGEIQSVLRDAAVE